MRVADAKANRELVRALRKSRTACYMVVPGIVPVSIHKTTLWSFVYPYDAAGIELKFEVETFVPANRWSDRQAIYVAVPVEPWLNQYKGSDYVDAPTGDYNAATARLAFQK